MAIPKGIAMPKKASILSSDHTRKVRGQLAAASRAGGDPNTILDLQREFRTAKLADHIRAVVDEAPPLTPAQREHLAALITGGETR